MLRSALLIVAAAVAVRHRAIVTQGDFILRAATWWRLINEYDSMKNIYDQHVADGFFVYGEPASSFDAVDQHPAFLELLNMRRLKPDLTKLSTIQFVADGATLPTYLPVEEGAGAALGMLGLALADLWTLRGQPAQQISISQVGAALSTAGYMFLEVEPHAPTNYVGCRGFEGTIAQEGVVNPVRKAYQVGGDGSWIFLHGGFPKLKKGILSFLNVSEAVGGGADKDAAVAAISAAVGAWSGSGVELEAAMQQAGLAATRCRTPAEWRATEQGKLVAAMPPVGVEPQAPGVMTDEGMAPGDPRSRQGRSFRRMYGQEDMSTGECKWFSHWINGEDIKGTCGRWRRLKDGAPRPLSDVIALDFSHVIASPMVGRTLAEHGALVLKVVTQKRPRRALFDEETNNGKHVIELDLEDADDRARLHALMAGADVLIDGYTDGVLGRHGFGEHEVATRYPDLVRVRVSCYGHLGPLKGAKGFQQNANFATGVATVADEANLGYQLVSQVDYATGYLGALGAVLALTDRQQLALEEEEQVRKDPDRGPRRGAIVRASLCQTATWMAKFGARMPTRSEFVWRVTRLMFGLGDKMVTEAGLTYLPPHESLMMSHTPPARLTGFHRWWTDGTVGKL